MFENYWKRFVCFKSSFVVNQTSSKWHCSGICSQCHILERRKMAELYRSKSVPYNWWRLSTTKIINTNLHYIKQRSYNQAKAIITQSNYTFIALNLYLMTDSKLIHPVLSISPFAREPWEEINSGEIQQLVSLINNVLHQGEVLAGSPQRECQSD